MEKQNQKATISKPQFMVVVMNEADLLRRIAWSVHEEITNESRKDEPISMETLNETVRAIKRLSTNITKELPREDIGNISKELTFRILKEMMETPEGAKRAMKAMSKVLDLDTNKIN